MLRLLLLAATVTAIAVVLWSGTPYVTAADADEPNLPSLEERQERLKAAAGMDEVDMALPDAPGGESLNMETGEAYEKALRAYYQYRNEGYTHRQRLFDWQLVSSKIIFAVVLLVVGLGMYFAAVQFHTGMRRSDKGHPPGEESTEFVFSLKEFKVRSPVLGVIVLTISLAFFYMYLVYVYPIENVF